MPKKNEKKTNAMRLLDAEGISYEVFTYTCDGTNFDGALVAGQVGLPCAAVFKTLVTRGEGGIVVCMVPVDRKLDLKSLAAAAGQKRLEMIPVGEITAITGYLRGGCSPLAMKKAYPAFIDESALSQQRVAVSAGVRGQQIYLASGDLIRAAGAVPGAFSQNDF
jgi:Cys-tRNA(Pro)/Cys-tRNA(Cys) deacylase